MHVADFWGLTGHFYFYFFVASAKTLEQDYACMWVWMCRSVCLLEIRQLGAETLGPWLRLQSWSWLSNSCSTSCDIRYKFSIPEWKKQQIWKFWGLIFKRSYKRKIGWAGRLYGGQLWDVGDEVCGWAVDRGVKQFNGWLVIERVDHRAGGQGWIWWGVKTLFKTIHWMPRTLIEGETNGRNDP